MTQCPNDLRLGTDIDTEIDIITIDHSVFTKSAQLEQGLETEDM